MRLQIYEKFLIIAVFTFSIIFLNSSNSFTCSRRISWRSYEKKIKTRKVSSDEKEMVEKPSLLIC